MKELFEYLLQREQNIELSVRDRIILGMELDVEELNIRGRLNLYATKITSLPDNLFIDGWMDISSSKMITKLPNGLRVRTFLDMANTNITELPNDIMIGQELNMTNTKITSLPDNLGHIQIFVDSSKVDYFRKKYPKYGTQIK